MQSTKRTLMQFANNAGPDHPAHKCRLIWACIVRLQNQWILEYAVFCSYRTPVLPVNCQWEFRLELLYLSICNVLNDVFKQLLEILSFSYFPSFYKFLVHFWTFLMLSSTPKVFSKINTKSKTSLHLLILFYRTINYTNFCVGFFILELDILL